jgi:methionyl-tRNA formyltransferase
MSMAFYASCLARLLRVAVCGAHAGGLQALREIVNFGCEITVVAAPIGERSPGATMERFAQKRSFPLVSAAEVKHESFSEVLRRTNTDLLISVQLPYLICAEALEAARIGCFNLHPSLLPRYAGLNPTAWAIYRGEQQHGVTLHWMTRSADEGPLVSQKPVPVSDSDTPPTLLRNCIRAGMPLIAELLAAASAGAVIPRIPQDLSQREYFGRQVPGGGRIDWNQPARQIANLVRAFNHSPFRLPWGYLTTEALGPKTAIMKEVDTGLRSNVAPGTVDEDGSQGGLRIAASDHWVRITESLTIG